MFPTMAEPVESLDYDSMACPKCGSRGSLHLDSVQSMVSCESCGFVLAESLVNTKVSSNLTFDPEGGSHGYILKTENANMNIAASLNNSQRHSKACYRAAVPKVKSAELSATDVSVERVTREPLNEIKQKLMLPPKVVYEAKCLFKELEISEVLLASPPASPASKKRSKLTMAKSVKKPKSPVKVERDARGGVLVGGVKKEVGEDRVGSKRVGTQVAVVSPPTSPSKSASQVLLKKLGFRGYSKSDVNILVGACVYAACRKLRVAILQEEISEAINCNQKTLNTVCIRLQKELELVLPAFNLSELLLRAISTLKVGGVMGKRGGSVHFVTQLRHCCMTLLKFCEGKYLTTGKKPMPMVAAVIHRSLETLRDDEGTFPGVTLARVSSLLGCSAITAESRSREISTHLLALKRELSDKPLSSLPALPEMEGGRQRPSPGWQDPAEISDEFVIEWIAKMQSCAPGDETAAAALLGCQGAPGQKRVSEAAMSEALERTVKSRMDAWQACLSDVVIAPSTAPSLLGRADPSHGQLALATLEEDVVGEVDDEEIDQYLCKPDLLNRVAFSHEPDITPFLNKSPQKRAAPKQKA